MTTPAPEAAPPVDAALATAHHLLALADDVEPEEVEALAVSRFADAGWRGPRALGLTGEAVLTGPWSVDAATRDALRLPTETAQVLLLRCPVQRGGPAPAPLADLDPKLRAFADGVPLGLESDAVDFLLAAAQRLGGVVRVAGTGAVLAPDPDADVNLLVHAPVWLDPDALVAALHHALPAFELVMDLVEPDLSTDLPPAAPPASGVERLDEGRRAWIHAESRAFDEDVLSRPIVLDAYGGAADLGPDGLVEVTVDGQDEVPLALQGLAWTRSGVVVYALRWWPPGEQARPASALAPAARAAAGRVRAAVESAALALHAAVGGEITDEAGFLIDPESLAPETS